MNLDSELTFSQAKKIAERNAFDDLKEYCNDPEKVFSERFMEDENCWMFFINEEIELPEDFYFGMKWAHVVSKKGAYRMVQDLSSDPEKLKEYIRALSDHFSSRGE